MADQTPSGCLQALFESALQAYERKTGITLAQHPLALKLQSCDSVEDITTLLQGQAKAFNDSRANDKIMKAIKTTVSILTPISDAASLADTVGLVRQGELIPCLTSLTIFVDNIPTCESSTRWSRHPTQCKCHLLVHIVGIFMTSKQIRQPMASYPATTHSSTCSSRSLNSSTASIYILGSLSRPKWSR